MTRSGESSPAPAIVLAAFGTTDEEAIGALTHIKRRVQAAFPDHETVLALTSRFIRRVWLRRALQAEYRLAHPELPEEIFRPLDPLSALAGLQQNGPRRVLVQSLHVTDGTEYRDLAAMVTQLAGITALNPAGPPFPGLALGPPALGDGSEIYLHRAAEALGELAAEARRRQAALVLMGHGNEHLQQRVYDDLAKMLRDRYDPDIHLGLVEGGPGLPEVVAGLRAGRPGRTLLLAPLMVVAGDHARNDLAGDEPESWASILAAEGYRIEVHLQGLGLNDSWADIYVEHLRELSRA
jgi:Cobalamin biosynthesis protein CbiK, Co2+ chelatase